jgi:hypothetical protein
MHPSVVLNWLLLDVSDIDAVFQLRFSSCDRSEMLMIQSFMCLLDDFYRRISTIVKVDYSHILVESRQLPKEWKFCVIHYKNYIQLVLEMSLYMQLYRTGTSFVPEFYTGTYQYMGAGLAQAV